MTTLKHPFKTAVKNVVGGVFLVQSIDKTCFEWKNLTVLPETVLGKDLITKLNACVKSGVFKVLDENTVRVLYG